MQKIITKYDILHFFSNAINILCIIHILPGCNKIATQLKEIIRHGALRYGSVGCLYVFYASYLLLKRNENLLLRRRRNKNWCSSIRFSGVYCFADDN